MSANPLISVIIAVYNGAKYIRKAVESVLEQTYQPVEIVIVDDGSTDNIREVLEPFIAKSLVRYVRQANAGHGEARNNGIRQSRGEYLCFLDHDDWLEKDALRQRLEVHARYPHLGLAFTDFRMAYDAGAQGITYRDSTMKQYRCIERLPADAISARDGHVCVFNQRVLTDLIVDCFIWVGTVMIPRRVLDEVGVFDGRFKCSPDHDLFIRIVRRFEIGFTDAITAAYFQHTSNMSLGMVLLDEAVRIRTDTLSAQHEMADGDRRRVRASIADYCARRAQVLIRDGRRESARRDAIRGLKFDPRCARLYKYFLLAAMPQPIVSALRRVRRVASS